MRVRGIRPIERQAEKALEQDPDDEEAEIVQGYCAAVRAALADDGLPPRSASGRYHERRSSGRRRASPGLVVMGSVRVISTLATRLRPEEGLVLRPGYVGDWKDRRAELETRRESRRKQRRFR